MQAFDSTSIESHVLLLLVFILTYPLICIIYQLLNLAFIEYEEFCRSQGVLSIHLALQPWWITPSALDMQNSSYPPKAEFNNCFFLLFIQNIYHKWVSPFCSLFFCSPKITQPCAQVFSVNSSITCSRLHI